MSVDLFKTERKMVWLMAFAIWLFTGLVYLKTITFGYVNWDDNFYVLYNPMLMKGGWEFIYEAFTQPYPYNWHPLTIISYRIDYMIWNKDPAGYHLTNTILHAVATSMVFLFGYKFFTRIFAGDAGKLKRFFAALFCALFFGIHPLHVESVAWVSERKDQLSAIFFVLSLMYYFDYCSVEGRGRGRFYLFSLVFFIFALLSKSMAVTLPIVLLLLDFYPFKRIDNIKSLMKKSVEKIPFVFLSAIVAVVTVLAQQKAIVSLTEKPISIRIAHVIQSYVFYIKKTILPDVLLPLYSHNKSVHLVSVETGVAFLVFAAITVLSVSFFKKRPYIAAAWAYYLVTLLPVIGIVQAGDQMAADRYMYIPSIGLFLLAGGCLGASIDIKTWRTGRLVAVTCALAVVALFTIKTLSQIDIWRDDETMWTHLLRYGKKDDRETLVLCYIKRGKHFFNMNRLDEAIEDYNVGLKIEPRTGYHYVLRGEAFQKRGGKEDLKMAETDFKRAMAIDCLQSSPYASLIKLYVQIGMEEKAAFYRRLVEQIEDDAKALDAEMQKISGILK